jgi:membrane protease YdiL (CAAX protease family)
MQNQYLRTEQHKAPLSILLHLVPGIIIVFFIFIFSNPFFTDLLGVDKELGPVVGYLSTIIFGLIPFQLGMLLIVGRKEKGKFTLKGILGYTEKSPLKLYLIYIPILIVYFMVLFVLVAPLIQPWIIDTFFSWWPEQYNFQLLMQEPSRLLGYQGIIILILLYILLSCITGPLVEELYFRGFLLPRMEAYAGKWAPLLNTVLFSFYHFFSPWENLVRIIASYPMIYLVWKKRDIRFSILVHIIVNSIGGLILLVTALRLMNQ